MNKTDLKYLNDRIVAKVVEYKVLMDQIPDMKGKIDISKEVKRNTEDSMLEIFYVSVKGCADFDKEISEHVIHCGKAMLKTIYGDICKQCEKFEPSDRLAGE